jgi:hypothetical protein
MNCETVKKDLSLFLYGELTLEEEQALQDHLEGCPACKQALEAEQRLHQALDERELEPPASLLVRSRQELERRLALAAPPRPGWLTWLKQPFGGGWQMAFKPLGAVALVALGFVAARWTSPGAVPVVAPGGEGVISRVRYLEPDPSGTLRVVVEETRQRVLAGSLEDEPIRRLLLAAARDARDPGLRGETVDLLKAKSGSLEVRRALLATFEHDPNPGVRLKALEGLKTFATEPEVRSTLVRSLLVDDNLGVRIQAIDLLTQKREDALVGVLQELMQRESNNYVRLRCQRALQEMNASVGTF